MKLKWTKFLSIILCLCLMIPIVALTACGEDKNVTVIYVTNFNGGVGTKWFDNAAERFKEKVKGVSYEDGKTGVRFEVNETMYINAENAKTDGTSMYFTQNSQNVITLSQKGLLLDITDIVTEPIEEDGRSIEDKLQADNKGFFMRDGKYYGLPHYEIYSGLSYDVDLFNEYDLYFASVETGNAVQAFPTDYGIGYFVKKVNDPLNPNNKIMSKKSCGPDGVFNTKDDGLPSSLSELIILCAKMDTYNIQPITGSGMHFTTYSSHLNCGIWTALAGKEQMRSNFTFNGEVEVVTGYSTQNAFEGINYIKKPITEKITLTEATGYKSYDMVSRYYSHAFFEIAMREGWLSNDISTPTVSHTGSQRNFIFSGIDDMPKVGMLVEGSYWYNESEDVNNFVDYTRYTRNEHRNVAWMPLPVNVTEPVTEGNGRKTTFLDVSSTSCFINAEVAKNPGLEKACKDFMKFLFTDAELSHFTEESGCAKPMNYELLPEDYNSLSPYFRSLWDLRKESDVVLQYGENNAFRGNRSDLLIYCDTPICQPMGYRSLWMGLKDGKTAQELFEGSRRTAAQWEKFID